MLIGSTMQAVVHRDLSQGMTNPVVFRQSRFLLEQKRLKSVLLNPKKQPESRILLSEGIVQYGMQSFDQSLMSFLEKILFLFKRLIDNNSNPDDF
jgi:hypothetical protein